VTITGVSSPGYSTPEDAYNNPPSNITVQITAWNDGGLNDITFDPQHYLAVDNSEVTFYVGGGNKSIAAITDFSDGWTVDANTLPVWLTITSPALDVSGIAHGLKDVKTTLTLATSSTTTTRSGEFYIVAGNLRKKITVTQSVEEEFSIFITDPVTGKPLDELAFEAGNTTAGALPAARSFRVTWFPASANCGVTLTPVAGMSPFTFNTTGSGVNPVSASPLTGGSALITIQPNALFPNDPNPLSRLDFTVTSGGQYRTAVLYLRQVNNYVILESVAAGYLADGTTTHSFTVKSNCPWLSYLDGGGSDLDNLINWKTLSGGPNPAGEPFKFILNARSNPEPATISFTNSDHSITYTTATIHATVLHLSLAETTYNTNTLAAHSKDVNINTNIPAAQLSATVTGTGGLVTGASIVAGPKLKVNLATNTLTGTSLQTYTVEVKYGGDVMGTLTVTVFGSGWAMVGGKLVGPVSEEMNAMQISENGSLCPTGSSQPRSSAEAIWYEANLGVMAMRTRDKSGNYTSGVQVITDNEVYANGQCVIWLGGRVDAGYYFSSFVLNGQVALAGQTVQISGNNYTRGMLLYANMFGSSMTAYATFRCVVW
ncbi:MAG: hypothetical protein LBI96_02280, partial [Odoribacteraceae bacterium]|nr:hypothetical protein [Odoribacteraceae bacterium]